MDRRTTAEQAADAIRAEIVSGNIQDGDEIVQEIVAKNLGLSRMPVREALRQLESEGLIERMDNRRTRVIGVTSASRRARFAMLCTLTRLAIEGLSARSRDEILAEFASASRAKEQFALHERIFQRTDDRFVRQLYASVFARFLGACLRGTGHFPDAEGLRAALRREGGEKELAEYYTALSDAIDGRDDP